MYEDCQQYATVKSAQYDNRSLKAQKITMHIVWATQDQNVFISNDGNIHWYRFEDIKTGRKLFTPFHHQKRITPTQQTCIYMREYPFDKHQSRR